MSPSKASVWVCCYSRIFLQQWLSFKHLGYGGRTSDWDKLIIIFLQEIWHYPASVFINSASGIRMIVFMFMSETLLDGLLSGWAKAKPDFRLSDCHSDEDWEKLKLQTLDWISFYNTIEVIKLFSTLIFFNFNMDWFIFVARKRHK